MSLAPPESTDEALAHPVDRALAFVLDGVGAILATFAVVMVGFALEAEWTFGAIVVVPVLAAAACTALTATAGTTPGKTIARLRVQDAWSGARPGWRAVPRGLVVIGPAVISFALGALVSGLVPAAAYGASWAWIALSVLLWVALLVVLARDPRFRGIQDRAGRTIVVRRRSA